MGTPPSPALARPGPAPAPLRGSWRFPRDSVVGSSHQFSAGPAEIADILRYLAVLAGPVPSCHLHLRSVPPGSCVRKIILCQRELGITGKAHVPKYPCPAANVPRRSGNRGCQGPPSPLLGVPKSTGSRGRCPRGSRCQVRAGAEGGGMCSPSAVERSVETDGALSQSSVFSWGCKMWGSAIKMGVSTLFDSRDNSRFFRKSRLT